MCLCHRGVLSSKRMDGIIYEKLYNVDNKLSRTLHRIECIRGVVPSCRSIGGGHDQSGLTIFYLTQIVHVHNRALLWFVRLKLLIASLSFRSDIIEPD